MLSNTNKQLTQQELKTLKKLLGKYIVWIAGDNPLVAQVIRLIMVWVEEDLNN